MLPGHFTSADARYLLYTLAHVEDRGKIDRYIGAKRGRLGAAQGGLDDPRTPRQWARLLEGGAFVVTVMTWNSGRGAGASSDILAGKVAEQR